MFGSLFIKECAQTMKSAIYWVIIIIMTIFFLSQVKSFDFQGKPTPGQEEYGYMYSDDKDIIMSSTLGNLVSEYNQESYVTYPIGFYKQVKINEKDKERIGEIIKETTGSHGEIVKETTESDGLIMDRAEQKPLPGLTYKRFTELMTEVDNILGGGSSYAENALRQNTNVPMTYEDALKEYNNLVEKDKFTGGYARLFSDYMGIMLAFLPVFLAVTRGLRDRRSSMQELIASRKASSFHIIWSRYLSIVFMILLPTILLSCFSLAECIKFASDNGVSYDLLAFIKYISGWLLPSIMISAAVGTVLTELTDTALGILIQGIWWFFALFSGVNTLAGGGYGWLLVPRHNTETGYEVFQENFAQLALNRTVYTVMAVVLVCISVWIYSMKRKGRLNIHGKIFRNRKRKSKA